MSLKDLIEKNDSGPGRLFDWFIQFLIVVSLVSLLQRLQQLATEIYTL